MEFVSDFFARKLAPGAAGEDARPPEWPGIRLRLAAAQAARRELLTLGAAASEHRGSFAAGAALALAELKSGAPDQCKRVVNPDALDPGNRDDRWGGSRDGSRGRPGDCKNPKVAG